MSGAEAAAELEEGGRLGPYRLERLLGRGGMGVVFKAVREPDGDVVALKVLRDELSNDDTYRQRFAREGRIAAGLSHRHLVPVVDAGEVDGRPYIAARFIVGRTLADVLEAEGPLALSPMLRTISEVATALDTLHREGLVHRDVKPANIMIDESGISYLTDFGLARGLAATVLTQPGRVVGTLDYLAPEVISGNTAGPASDIYALGCVTYECIAGRPPFGEMGIAEAALASIQDEPADPCEGRSDLPKTLSFAVLQALAKSPADRPPTAAAYALMLRISARPVPARA
ncbi:MAG TPA: serine/threonine-protein kinase [Gaiellaceae bacterium]|nr:serine/threonine-protein kinase [Gaiellaceae bacterium]